MASTSSRLDEFVEMRAAITRSVAKTWGDKRFEAQFLDNAEEAMRKTFGYELPFAIDFEAHRSGGGHPRHFDPVHTGGWVGPNNTIEMVLPPAPPKEQQAEALAAYNASHLLFLTDRKQS